MPEPLKSITIRGFRSIDALENFELTNLNVLIGANGAGKSNFVEFFRMLRALADESFQRYVNDSGGGDGFLFLGPKVTSKITAVLQFGFNVYEFTLKPTAQGTLQVAEEEAKYGGFTQGLSSGGLESALKKRKDEPSRRYSGYPGVAHYVYSSVSSWTVYHFHDTSALAPMRRDQARQDWERFRHDASNIASFLLNLRDDGSGSYQLIRDTVRLIAPFFDDFLFRPQNAAPMSKSGSSGGRKGAISRSSPTTCQTGRSGSSGWRQRCCNPRRRRRS